MSRHSVYLIGTDVDRKTVAIYEASFGNYVALRGTIGGKFEQFPVNEWGWDKAENLWIRFNGTVIHLSQLDENQYIIKNGGVVSLGFFGWLKNCM